MKRRSNEFLVDRLKRRGATIIKLRKMRGEYNLATDSGTALAFLKEFMARPEEYIALIGLNVLLDFYNTYLYHPHDPILPKEFQQKMSARVERTILYAAVPLSQLKRLLYEHREWQDLEAIYFAIAERLGIPVRVLRRALDYYAELGHLSSGAA